MTSPKSTKALMFPSSDKIIEQVYSLSLFAIVLLIPQGWKDFSHHHSSSCYKLPFNLLLLPMVLFKAQNQNILGLYDSVIQSFPLQLFHPRIFELWKKGKNSSRTEHLDTDVKHLNFSVAAHIGGQPCSKT